MRHAHKPQRNKPSTQHNNCSPTSSPTTAITTKSKYTSWCAIHNANRRPQWLLALDCTHTHWWPLVKESRNCHTWKHHWLMHQQTRHLRHHLRPTHCQLTRNCKHEQNLRHRFHPAPLTHSTIQTYKSATFSWTEPDPPPICPFCAKTMLPLLLMSLRHTNSSQTHQTNNTCDIACTRFTANSLNESKKYETQLSQIEPKTLPICSFCARNMFPLLLLSFWHLNSPRTHQTRTNPATAPALDSSSHQSQVVTKSATYKNASFPKLNRKPFQFAFYMPETCFLSFFFRSGTSIHPKPIKHGQFLRRRSHLMCPQAMVVIKLMHYYDAQKLFLYFQESCEQKANTNTRAHKVETYTT